MKILIISQYFWPENFRINDLATGLVARGNDVYVLTGTPNYPSGRFFKGYGLFRKTFDNYNGAKVIRVPIVPRGSNNIMLVMNYLSYAIVGSMFSFFLTLSRFDIIFVCQLSPVTVGIPAKVLKTLTKKPIIHWILDLWPESIAASGAIKTGWVFGLVDRIVRSVYRSADKILVGSKGFIPSVCSRNVSAAIIEYFPNWVEPEYIGQFTATDLPDGTVLPEGFLIMFAGAVGVAQDFGSIMRAAEALRSYHEIHWVILGDGRMLGWVKQQVQQRGLEPIFHLLGRFQSDLMPTFFSRADAMLVTLKKDPMFAITVPGKIQSYMACGKPIIAALDGEGAELVRQSEVGLTSPAEDPERLAENVLRMYRMRKSDREKMGKNGLQFCREHFEREMLIGKLEGWMREVCKKPVDKNNA